MFTFVCQHCAKDFDKISRVSSNGKPFQFCSPHCSAQSRVKQDVYQCPECSTEFTYKAHRVHCSRACYHEAKRKQGMRKKVCNQCGDEFDVLGKARARERTFCSKACTSRSRMTNKLDRLGGIESIKAKIVKKAEKQGYWLGSIQARAMFRVRHEFFQEFGISLDEINRSLGHTKPKSGFEELVNSAIESVLPDATIEREAQGPITEKGYPTRFDFMVDGHLVIEADGPQHTDEANSWHSEGYVKRDRLKERYCQEQGMPMIRVLYSNGWTLERLIDAMKAMLISMNHNVASNGERDGLRIIEWGQSAAKPSGKPAEGSTTNAHFPNGYAEGYEATRVPRPDKTSSIRRDIVWTTWQQVEAGFKYPAITNRFDGENYVCIARPTTLRPFKDDLETLHSYTTEGWNRVMNGENGRYEGIRFVSQTNIVSEGWSNGDSDAAYFFGADTVTEAVAVPEEVRAKIPDDYGRGKGIAWYALNAFAITHADTTSDSTKAQARILKWASTS